MELIVTHPEAADDQVDDHTLMQRIAKRDMAAYSLLIDRHLNLSVRFAERLLGSRADAEDIVQNICLKLWNDAHRWQPKAKVSTWLYRVIVNACIDHRRKFMRFVPAETELETLEDTAPSAEESLQDEQRSMLVQNALQLLPQSQRTAIVLSYYEELSNQEAADVMGLTLGAFQQLLFRARQSLKTKLIPLEAEQLHG